MKVGQFPSSTKKHPPQAGSKHIGNSQKEVVMARCVLGNFEICIFDLLSPSPIIFPMMFINGDFKEL